MQLALKKPWILMIKHKLVAFSAISGLSGLIIGLMIGGLSNSNIVTIDLERILSSKAKSYSQISDEQEREYKLSVLPNKLKQIFTNLGSDIVVDKRCILRAHNRKIIDKTNVILKKLP